MAPFLVQTIIFHEKVATTADMAVLPSVLGSRTLRRTFQVRLGTETLRVFGGTSIFEVSLHRFMENDGFKPLLSLT